MSQPNYLGYYDVWDYGLGLELGDWNFGIENCGLGSMTMTIYNDCWQWLMTMTNDNN